MTTYTLDNLKVSEMNSNLLLTIDWKRNSDYLSKLLEKYAPFIDVAACWSQPGEFNYFTNNAENFFKSYFKDIKRPDMVQSRDLINSSFIPNSYAVSITLDDTYLGMLLIHVKKDFHLKEKKGEHSPVENNSKVISIDSDLVDAPEESVKNFLKLLAKALLPQLSLAKYATTMATEVERRTSTDKLTGLWNRNYFNERFREECFRLTTTKEQGAVVIISLDELAAMEKVLPKDEHEKLIVQASNLVRKVVRKTDWIVYWDKHEILVYLTNTQPESSIDVMNRCANQLINAHPLLTPLVGLCSTNETNSARALIQLSARRLDLARKDGRKMLVCFAAKDGLKFIQMAPRT